jgi:hypothetical protein
MPATVKKKTKKYLNGNNVRMADLPEFAQENWRNTFLPTLYDKFFASDQPFDGFCKGSEKFTALLQCIVEEVYPDIDYEVTSSDGIHFLVRLYSALTLAYHLTYFTSLICFSIQAYNRINEKRSKVGSNAIDIVKQYLGTLKGANAAKDWLRWSLRGDGPLFFKVPSPMSSPTDQKDPEYQVSRCFLDTHNYSLIFVTVVS